MPCGAAGLFGGVTSKSQLTTNLLQGQIESNYDETVDNFDSMDLKPELLRGESLEYSRSFEMFLQRCSIPAAKTNIRTNIPSQVFTLMGKENLHGFF